MSVLIRGMEMPKSCSECGQFRWNNYLQSDVCRITEALGGDGIFHSEDEGIENRAAWCPLVPVPPHGRLIDADALMKEMDKQENAMFEHGREFTFSFKSGGDICTAWYNVEMMVEDAPTIIEKEGE